MGRSKIEWTDVTWNPVVGCTPVSEGCAHCYASRLHTMRYKAWLNEKDVPVQYSKPFSYIQLMPHRLQYPLYWKKPRRIFVNSMSDLFHEDVSFEFIFKVLSIIESCPQHIFQVLTKRPKRIMAFMHWLRYNTEPRGYGLPDNLWLGVTAENQAAADERIPQLLTIPAKIHFVSCEPLLSAINISRYYDGIDWLIVGGETGPDARPMDPDWVRLLRDRFADKAFFFKQWGAYAPDKYDVMKATGKKKVRELDGREWNHYPLTEG